ncbi:MAG: Cobalt ATP-binding cassette-like protein, partial [Bacteroidetes bacterium]|nr:Cobalt ATP-binding cassette-like protein [Bacteroidota bacterium]
PSRQMTSPTVERELAFGLENTGTGSERMGVEVNEALSRLGFERYRHTSPGNLSGGEQQRLALAAVMLLRPRYLVLDEATSLLAGSARAAMLDDLRATLQGEHRCLIAITHFPRDAESAERLVVLHQGALVADGTPASVFSHPARLRALGVPVPLRFLFAFPA